MEGHTVALDSGEWVVGERIGGGGFGRVHAASRGAETCVLKFVPKAPGADRELLFASPDSAANVVPVLETGEHGGHLVLRMPRAARSLRARIQAGPLDLDEALAVLKDVALALTALAALDEPVVHRDLKPENVLELDGTWCLADFGISRYAEATTATDTRKFSMTPQYAAPEQWLHERATAATDVYSLGTLAYEILSGALPFPGPTGEDYRDQHLHVVPALLTGVPVALSALVEECLTKVAAARPTAANLLARVDRIQRPANPAMARLREAHQKETRRLAEDAAAAAVRRTEAERRQALVAIAEARLQRIVAELVEAIVGEAPTAFVSTRGDATAIRLGRATLSVARCSAATGWGNFEPPAFDVVAYSSMTLRVADARHYDGRDHSLWFGDIQQPEEFGWFETAFMQSAILGMGGGVPRTAPAAMPPGADSAGAVGTGMHVYQLAWPFTRLDPGNLDDWIERWATWFADATTGDLGYPGSMPERPTTGSWRRKT